MSMTDSRSCDECSKCCEGWFAGTAHGHSFYPGKPCHFLGKGCTIYENRPEKPCKTFNCEWLVNNELPAWMRPDMCNAILKKRTHEGIEFYDLVEAGQKLDSAVLSWFIIWSLNNHKNLNYSINGGRNKIGAPEFLALQI